MTNFTVKTPIRVGIVGTGYAANKRAEAIQIDPRCELMAVSGHTPAKTEQFSSIYNISKINTWQELVKKPDVDLVFICSINQEHEEIAREALKAEKHVVVEYPMSLESRGAASLIKLARQKNKLLHIEHIEILGGMHQTIRQHLAEIGEVFYGRYTTIRGQHPAPCHWTYHRERFGFPLCAALSRVHRFTNLFGKVKTVSCQSRYWDTTVEGYYSSCLVEAQLSFYNGLIAQVTYGKGNNFWCSDRTFELHGDRGSLIFVGEKGTLVKGEEKIPLEVNSRHGLFAEDTRLVLNHLVEGTPLYVKATDSEYALSVAVAAHQSAITGETVKLS